MMESGSHPGGERAVGAYLCKRRLVNQGARWVWAFRLREQRTIENLIPLRRKPLQPLTVMITLIQIFSTMEVPRQEEEQLQRFKDCILGAPQLITNQRQPPQRTRSKKFTNFRIISYLFRKQSKLINKDNMQRRQRQLKLWIKYRIVPQGTRLVQFIKLILRVLT